MKLNKIKTWGKVQVLSNRFKWNQERTR